MKKSIYAGFWIRALASIIDWTIIVVLSIICVDLIWPNLHSEAFSLFEGQGVDTEEFDPDQLVEALMMMADIMLFSMIAASYFILFGIWKGATPGKMIVRIKIVSAETLLEPSVGSLIGRYLAYTVSVIPLYLGFLWVAWGKDKRGFHDKLAGTAVIYPARVEWAVNEDGYGLLRTSGNHRPEVEPGLEPERSRLTISAEQSWTCYEFVMGRALEEAIGDQFPAYRRVFIKILDKSGVGGRDISDAKARKRIAKTSSWSWVGFLFNMYWGIYRRLVLGWACLIVFIGVSVPGIPGLGGIFGFFVALNFGLYGRGNLLASVLKTYANPNIPLQARKRLSPLGLTMAILLFVVYILLIERINMDAILWGGLDREIQLHRE